MKNIIEEIYEIRKKMRLINEMNFENIDDESIEKQTMDDLHTSVIEYILYYGEPVCDEITFDLYVQGNVSEQAYAYCSNKEYYDNILSNLKK